MDVFTGQMTTEVLNASEEANILIINVPAYITKFYQPLDPTVTVEQDQTNSCWLASGILQTHDYFKRKRNH